MYLEDLENVDQQVNQSCCFNSYHGYQWVINTLCALPFCALLCTLCINIIRNTMYTISTFVSQGALFIGQLQSGQ